MLRLRVAENSYVWGNSDWNIKPTYLPKVDTLSKYISLDHILESKNIELSRWADGLNYNFKFIKM